MWKNLLLVLAPSLVDLLFDALILAAEKLAAKTDTTIDDEWVAKLKEYRGQLTGIVKEEIKNPDQIKNPA